MFRTGCSRSHCEWSRKDSAEALQAWADVLADDSIIKTRHCGERCYVKEATQAALEWLEVSLICSGRSML